MSDPYSYPGTDCLVNKLGITDSAALFAAEFRLVSIRDVQAARTSIHHYYGELNVCHPFREGNGRTLRAFLRQLSAAAGYQLDWSELNKSENIEACRRHLSTADVTMLVAVLDPVVSRIS